MEGREPANGAPMGRWANLVPNEERYGANVQSGRPFAGCDRGVAGRKSIRLSRVRAVGADCEMSDVGSCPCRAPSGIRFLLVRNSHANASSGLDPCYSGVSISSWRANTIRAAVSKPDCGSKSFQHESPKIRGSSDGDGAKQR